MSSTKNILHQYEFFSSCFRFNLLFLIQKVNVHIPTEVGEADERSRKTFYREFKKVVDASDIIIQVLDARDPLGCRCPQVEQAVQTGKNKKLILLLNKIGRREFQ